MEELKCRSCSMRIKCSLIHNAKENNEHVWDILNNHKILLHDKQISKLNYGWNENSPNTIWVFSGDNMLATLNRMNNKREFVLEGVGLQKWKIFCPQIKTAVFEFFAEKEGVRI